MSQTPARDTSDWCINHDARRAAPSPQSLSVNLITSNEQGFESDGNGAESRFNVVSPHFPWTINRDAPSDPPQPCRHSINLQNGVDSAEEHTSEVHASSSMQDNAGSDEWANPRTILPDSRKPAGYRGDNHLADIERAEVSRHTSPTASKVPPTKQEIAKTESEAVPLTSTRTTTPTATVTHHPSVLVMPDNRNWPPAYQRIVRSPTSSIPLPPTPVNAIPTVHAHKTLVVCFDGTGESFGKEDSNVVDFYSMLKKGDSSQQIVYYQPGIGTYLGRRGTSGGLRTKIAKLWDEAVAWNLASHVKEGYSFLMQNYVNGDKISIFGFSRGAYTGRALAGMLHKVGLLTPGNDKQISFAYKMFASTDKQSWKDAERFKYAFSIDVKVDFIGVWDTVRSVGLFNKTLPFSTSNNSIRAFRHAVALDERRTKFQANLWNPPTEEDAALGTQYDDDYTDTKEVWFAGAHCDVGGGVSSEDKYSLAKLALRWMVKECFRCNTGIMFDTEKVFMTIGLTANHLTSPSLLSPRFSTDPSEFVPYEVKWKDPNDYEVYEREEKDLLKPIHDQLAIVPSMWWILEILPLHRTLPGGYATETDAVPMRGLRKFLREHPINIGRGRRIPNRDSTGTKQPIYVHHTVHERMTQREYTPLARNWKQIVPSIIWTD